MDSQKIFKTFYRQSNIFLKSLNEWDQACSKWEEVEVNTFIENFATNINVI